MAKRDQWKEDSMWMIWGERERRWEDGVPSLPLTEWLIGVALPMLSCWETGHWWMGRLQGDVYFVVNLHICMYLRGGWLLLARISPHLNMIDLAVWQNGQLSDRDIQSTLCSHDGWAHANTQPDQRWNPAAPWPVEEGPERVCNQKCNHAIQIFNRTQQKWEHIELHNHEWSFLLIMHNYAFKFWYPHTHPSQGWRSAVCALLPLNQIECQTECQTMRDGSSSCQYLQRHTHRCFSYWTKPQFGSGNSPWRAQVCFRIPPPSMGWGEKLRRWYCVDGG